MYLDVPHLFINVAHLFINVPQIEKKITIEETLVQYSFVYSIFCGHVSR